jgi:hypothetical protein
MVLARYYIRHDPARIDGLSSQFAGLAAAEPNPERLRRYTRDVLEMAPHVMRRSSPQTAYVTQEVLVDRFQPA